MKPNTKPLRLEGLPETLRAELKAARLRRGWSQLDLGRRIGLPQAHISGIETGKTVPRYDTLLDLVRVLDFDLVMVPRSIVPAVHALIRDSQSPDADTTRSLYAFDDDEAAADES
jgi:transcriptional regulator with XRE-family HTH domain